MIKTNLQIRSLAETAIEQIHAAFTDAFSDYEVPIDMPLKKLQEMMITRDLKPEYSVGCFDGDKLVGFILTGYRITEGIRVCYDGGTGVIKDYQRKGIGEMMLSKLLQHLKEKETSFFLLEVLENNTPAINLYEKYGFRITRRLECFELEKPSVSIIREPGIQIQVYSPSEKIQADEEFRLYLPTWQNEIRSVLNAGENYTLVTLSNEGGLLCYGYIHKTKGDIPQTGILPREQNRNLEALLIGELAKHTESEKLFVLNVEENNYWGQVFRKLEFNNFVNQFEMILQIV